MRSSYLPYAAVAVLLLGGGVLAGLWSDRWAPSAAVEEAVDRLKGVPTQVRDWTAETDGTLTDDEVRAGRIAGYVYRTYTNRRTRQKVTMLLLCGRSGPISVHTPDVCYGGAGYKPETAKIPYSVEFGDDKADFDTMDLKRDDGGRTLELRIFWGWKPGDSPADGWRAPGNPRFTFARHKALYKLYVLRDLDDGTPRDDDPCVAFLQEMLPALKTALQTAE